MTDKRRVRLGMVGGGQGAFIGAVHRIASRIDDRFELVAGALSSDGARAAASAADLAAHRWTLRFRQVLVGEASLQSSVLDKSCLLTKSHQLATA